MSTYRKCFTLNKVRNGFNVDKGTLDPRKAGTLGKDFEEKYYTYLEKSVFESIGDEVDFQNFIGLIIIVESIESESLPIQIRSSRSEPFKRRIINVLGKFLDEHYDTLVKLYEMYVGNLNNETKERYREAFYE